MTQDLSVVIIPLVGGAALAASVAALRQQDVNEIVIVASEAVDQIDGARLVSAARGATVPQRRLDGFRATSGKCVAFVEDTCIPAPGWAAALTAAFADPEVAAAGGPVDIDPALPPRARALGVCEYAAFGDGRAPSDKLAGANFALRRTVGAGFDKPEDFIDNRLFDTVRRAGKISFRPEARVTYAAAPPAQTRLSARYHHGRIYGGMFSARRSLGGRIASGLVAFGAPLALMARSFAHATPTLARSPQTLMWTMLMHCSWSCGEVVGKFTGDAGASLERWA